MASIRIFGQRVPIVFFILALVELVIFVASVYMGAYFRNFLTGDLAGSTSIDMVERITGPLIPASLVFASVMIVSMVSMGLYNISYLRLRRDSVILRIFSAHVFGTLLFIFVVYAIPSFFLGRSVLIIAIICSSILIWVARKVFVGIFDSSIGRRNVLVYGSGTRAKSIELIEEQLVHHGVRLCGFIRVNKEAVDVSSIHIVDNFEPLPDLAVRLDVDEIVVAAEDRRNSLMIDELLECRLKGIVITDIATFFERESGKLQLEVMSPSSLIFSSGFDHSYFRAFFERSLDLFGSSVLLAVSWPIMLITALMIKMEDGLHASVIYRQTRIGKNGHPFSVLKFRSMREDAEKLGAVWAIENDDRVTRVGAVIRKLRIDELPQILNVLNGEMSFVGPRPERPEFVKELIKKLPYYGERHRVKPGITGWAQLNYPYGASDRDALEKLQYDMYYTKNHSFLLDLFILVQTVEIVVFGKGSR